MLIALLVIGLENYLEVPHFWLTCRALRTKLWAIVLDHAKRHMSVLRLLGKHQIASGISTAVDFATMIVAVSLCTADPVLGTMIGAGVGAITNFSLGRQWTFQVAHHPANGQAIRYVVVSGASLALNGMGEHVFAIVLGLQYIFARVITAIIVNMAWNFPLQRYFVFRPFGEHGRAAPPTHGA